MKTIRPYLIALMLVLSNFIFSQELIVEEDEFKDETKTYTSWETLNAKLDFTAYFSFWKSDVSDFFQLKLMITNDYPAVKEGYEVIFKLSNGKTVTLVSPKYYENCTGCGAKGFGGSAAPGVYAVYPITDEQLQILSSATVTKFRIETTKGRLEAEPRKKVAEKIKTAAALIN